MSDKPRLVRVNFEVEAEERARLKVYAAKQGKSIAEVMRDLVRALPR